MRYAPLLVLLVAVAALAGARRHIRTTGTSQPWSRERTRKRPRRIRGVGPDQRGEREPGRRLRSRAGRHALAGGHVCDGRQRRRRGSRKRVRPPRLARLARLRLASLGPDRGQRGQRHRDDLQGPRRSAARPQGGLVRRPVPGQHRRPRAARLRAERRRPRHRAGLLAPRPSPAADRRLGEVAGAREREPAELPELSGPGRLQPERAEADS